MKIPGKASMFVKTGFHKRFFYELPIIIDRFFVKCLNIAVLKIFMWQEHDNGSDKSAYEGK